MFGHLTDMARTEEDLKGSDRSVPISVDEDRYPWGLRISLTQDELTKLGVDTSDWEIGGVFHIHALVKVVSKSEDATVHGERCNVGLQITHLAGIESEDEEDEEEEKSEPSLEKHGYLRYNK